MTRSIPGRMHDGKIEVETADPPAEGTAVTVVFQTALPPADARLLQRGKYQHRDGLTSQEFRELRRQLSTEWETELDEFFPPRN